MPWNEPFNEVQVVRVNGPRTIINLNKRYHPGLNDLEVLLNGIEAVAGKDYEETDAYTVTFLFELKQNDTVIFRRRKQ